MTVAKVAAVHPAAVVAMDGCPSSLSTCAFTALPSQSVMSRWLCMLGCAGPGWLVRFAHMVAAPLC